VEGVFTAPAPRVSQGDVYGSCASLFVDSRPLTAVRRTSAPTPTARLFTEGSAAPPGGFRWDEAEYVVGRATLALGIMVTHDCELDKDDHFRTMALIRPWHALPPEAAESIRAGERLRFFHLPEAPPHLPESYVDFRRLTTVRGRVLNDGDRLLSMTEHGRAALREAFINFVTRAEG
jgi:hypothetical protein